MKLRTIKGHNIKGRTFKLTLSDAVAIIGPNFAGKSAIPDAIRLLFQGYLSEVGKLPSATWDLSGGEEMTTEGTFDNEAKFSRRFYLKNGSPATAAYADDGVPVSDLESIPLLNAEHYFSLTDAQRVNYVFERITLPDTYSRESIIAGIEQISLGEAHTEQVQKAKQALVVDVRQCFAGTSVQVALDTSMALFRDRFTYWNRRAKETQGAVKTLTELKLRESETSADSMAALQREIAAATEKKTELDEKKGELTAKRDEAERTAYRKKEIRNELDADRTDYPRMIANLRAEIKKLTGQLKPVAKNLPDMLTKAGEARETRGKVSAGLAEQERIIKKATERLEGLADLKCCPFCKSKGKDWKANLEEEINVTLGKATTARDDGTEILAVLDKSVATLQREIDSANQNETANKETNVRIADKNREIERLSAEQTRETGRREKLETEFTGLEKLPDSHNLGPEIEKLEAERLEISRELSRLNGKRESARALEQDLKRAAQAQIEHEDANAYVVMIKAIATYLKKKREGIVADVFEKLLAVANQLCGDILMTPIALHEGTIGRWGETKFIKHKVFSGTEKALAYIAIAIALSVDAPIRIPILDEFGRLDEDNQRAVIEVLHDMVTDGVIDQFIIVGTGLPKLLPKDDRLQVIEVKP